MLEQLDLTTAFDAAPAPVEIVEQKPNIPLDVFDIRGRKRSPVTLPVLAPIGQRKPPMMVVPGSIG